MVLIKLYPSKKFSKTIGFFKHVVGVNDHFIIFALVFFCKN